MKKKNYPLSRLLRASFAAFTGIIAAGCAAEPVGAGTPEASPSRAGSPLPEVDQARFQAYAYFSRAVGYEEQAKRAWREALFSAPGSRSDRLKQIQQATTTWQKAVDYFQEVLRLDAQCGPAYSHLGLGYLLFGEEDNACRYLRLASRYEPDNFEVHVKLAHTLEKAGNLDEATDEYEQALKVPDTPAKIMLLDHIYLRLADLYQKAGKPQQAVARLEELVALVKELPLAYGRNSRLRHWVDEPTFLYLRIARLMMDQGQSEAALAQLLKAQKLSPDNSEVDMLLARAYRDRSNYTQAEKACKRLLKRTPHNQQATLLLADIYQRQGNTTEAQKLYQQLVTRRSRDPESYLRLSEIWQAEGKPPRALLALAQGVEAGAPWEKLAGPMDKLLQKVKAPEEVLQAMQELTEPQDRRFCFYLVSGRLAESAGDIPSAIKHYQKSKELLPAFSPAYAYQALAQVKIDRAADAIVTLEEARDRNVFIPHLQELLGKLYFEENRFTDAEQALKQELKRHGASPSAHLYLGLCYDRLGQIPLAQKELKEALKLDPDNPALLNAIAVFYLDHGIETATAVKLLKQALAKEPRNVTYLSNLAWGYCLQEEKAQGDELIQQATKLAGKDVEAHYYIASVLHRLDRRKEAEAKLNFILTLDPEHAPSNNDLGYLYAEQAENLEEAETLVKRALEKEPDNGAYIDSLGWVYFKQGRTEQALEQLQRASLKLPDAEVYEHLGEVLSKLGRRDDARKAWQKALELEPDRTSVRERLKQSEETENNP